VAIAIAGDDSADLDAVATLVDALGFDPVIAGSLADGIRFEPGTELFGAVEPAEEVRARLDRFPQTARGRTTASART
jgi:predicted dinucleotide-binding enzyme